MIGWNEYGMQKNGFSKKNVIANPLQSKSIQSDMETKKARTESYCYWIRDE
jgi:hypothetical protein